MSDFIKSSDIKEFSVKLTRYLIKAKTQGRKTNKDLAEEILRESELEVPKVSGTLASAQFIIDTENVNGKIQFGYGGPNAQVNPKTGISTNDYMLRMHEDLSLEHPVGKSKFLRDPFIRNLNRLREGLANGLRKVRP